MERAHAGLQSLPAWLRQHTAHGPACIIYTGVTVQPRLPQHVGGSAVRRPKQSANQQKITGLRVSSPWPCVKHAAETLGAAMRGQSTQTARLLAQKGCAHSPHPTLAPHLEFKDPPPRFCPSAHVVCIAAHTQCGPPPQCLRLG